MTNEAEDALQRTWPDSARRVRERWSRLTADDLAHIDGKRAYLVSKIQERYGYPRDRAERECQIFVDELDSSGYARLLRIDERASSRSGGASGSPASGHG